MEETRKLQLYVTESQYQMLRQWAGKHGSIAAVVRDLIDRGFTPKTVESDPFVQWARAEKEGSGDTSPAEDAKRRMYNAPS